MKRKVLILSGPTHEYFDAVRYIGNASSGKMGKALAEEALACGFFVEFITGPVAEQNLPDLGKNQIHPVQSSEEMLAAAKQLFQTSDIIIFAAAVADYAPVEKHEEKRSKSETELLLKLRPTPDIAKTLCEGKHSGQTAIGFALQTSDGPAKARAKLEAKNLDGIVLNTPTTLGAENGQFSFLSIMAADFDSWGCISKTECVKRIFKAIEQMSR